MQEKINKTEKQETGPKLSFHFLFSAHSTEIQARNIEKNFKEADIFAPEYVGLDEEDSQNLKKLSEGDTDPQRFSARLEEKYGKSKDFRKGSFFYKISEIIHGSKKPILLADLSKEQIEANKEWADEASIGMKMLKEAADLFNKGKFEESLVKGRQSITALAQRSVLEREKVVVENMKQQLSALMAELPELRSRKELKILVTFGAIHTTLPRTARSEFPGADFSTGFNFLPYIYSTFHEAERRVIFNKPVTDDIVAKGIAELIINGHILKKLNLDDSEVVVVAVRKLFSKITMLEIKRISQGLGWGVSLENVLRGLGIILPQTKEELDKLLKS